MLNTPKARKLHCFSYDLCGHEQLKELSGVDLEALIGA